MIRLPISGQLARWRPVTGHEDVALTESAPGLDSSAQYAERMATGPDGDALDAGDLPVGDLDLLVLARRREVLGDAITAEGVCPACAAPVDVTFSLAAYADHHRPRSARGVHSRGDGWWTMRDGTSFRLPTVRDLSAAAAAPSARVALMAACVRKAPGADSGDGGDADAIVGARAGRAAERAMSVLGPTLRTDVAGVCPECGADALLDIDARELCMSELRYVAGTVFAEVHLLARTYGWSQADILDLPSSRRQMYAGLVTSAADAGAIGD
jgi:hypothetical protein